MALLLSLPIHMHLRKQKHKTFKFQPFKNCMSIKKYLPHVYCCSLLPVSRLTPSFATGFSVQDHQAWMCKCCLPKASRGRRAVSEFRNLINSFCYWRIHPDPYLSQICLVADNALKKDVII